jgi:hypothetical protein
MKKIALIAALALLGGSLFAYGPGGNGNGPGFGQDINWKVGTVVTTEYKKATGQVTTATTLWGNALTFKADGVEYQLWLPRTSALSTLKSGDTITVEGTFTTIKADTKVSPVVHPFKVTVNGKEIDLTDNFGPGRGGMMGGNSSRR